MRRLVIVLQVVLLSIVSQSCGNSDQSSEGEIESKEQIENRLITEASFSNLDGESFSLESYKGKTVILNLWATWCKPCIYEMPSISRASEILGEEAVFLAASDESLEKIEGFREKYPDFKFQIIKLQESVLNFEVQVLPTTFIINEEGEIVSTIVGGREWDSPKQIDLIRNS